MKFLLLLWIENNINTTQSQPNQEINFLPIHQVISMFGFEIQYPKEVLENPLYLVVSVVLKTKLFKNHFSSRKTILYEFEFP